MALDLTPSAISHHVDYISSMTANERRTHLKKVFFHLADALTSVPYDVTDHSGFRGACDLLQASSGKTINQNINMFNADMMTQAIYILCTSNNEDEYINNFAELMGWIGRGVQDKMLCVKAPRAPHNYIHGYHTKIREWYNELHNDGYIDHPSKGSQLSTIFHMADSKNITVTATKTEKNMDDFDVNKATDLVLALANHRAMADDIEYQHNAKTAVQNSIDDAVTDIGEKLSLSAKQRLSLKSSVALVIDTTEIQHMNLDNLEPLKTLGIELDTDDTADETDVSPSVDIKYEPITIDPNLKQAINTMIKSSGVESTDIEKDLNDLALLRAKAVAWEEEIKYLKGRTFTAPIALEGEAVIDGDTLKYTIVQKNAMELFKNPRTGKKIKQLDFNIPTLVWTDASGKEVKHPMCPEVVDHYQFRATHLIKFLTGFIMGKNIWCHGHTGTGKTTLPEQVSAVIGFPVFPLNLDSQLERADLTGQTDIVNEGGTSVTKFREGILPRAMVQPCILVLDEIDAGKPDVMFVIQRATEGKGLLLTEDGGRLVKPHPLFRFVATANSRGQGDEYGVYAGVRPMNGALLNRFPIFIEVDYMSKDEEGTFLKRTYSLADDVIDNITTFAGLCRASFTQGETTVPVSPRDTMAMCEMYAFYETILTTKTQAMEFAVTTSVIDRAPLDNRQRVIELADRAFASCKFTS